MPLPTYEQWMKDTYSLTAKRSPTLLALDEAIKKPNAQDADVKVALERWIEEQIDAGKDWRQSVRNSKGAVTSLFRYLNDNRKLSTKELEAMAYVAKQQKLALAKLFAGKKVKLKWEGKNLLAGDSRTKFSTVKAVVTKTKSAHSTAKELVKNVREIGDKTAGLREDAEIRAKIIDICDKLCKGVDVNEVLSVLGLGNVQSFAADIAPLFGLISSGAKVLAGWAGVAETAWRQQSIGGSRYAIAPGDPEAAFDAILELLTRELKSKTGKAGIATVAFGGKVAGTFADGGAVTGPLVGALETLAGIMQNIFECARDCRERDLANALLDMRVLDLELFKMCPLLGCYYLVVQDHSTIINIAVAEYGGAQFVFDAERMIAKVRPVLTQARAYIEASRLEIADMEKAKGIAAENWHVKGKLGKLADLPNHVVESIGAGIVAKLSKPDEVPVVDRARIIGYDYLHSRDRADAVSLPPTRPRSNAVSVAAPPTRPRSNAVGPT